MIQWIRDKWIEWRSYEECGKWFVQDAPGRPGYCTRKHNHRGHHKEKR